MKLSDADDFVQMSQSQQYNITRCPEIKSGIQIYSKESYAESSWRDCEIEDIVLERGLE